MKNILLAIVLLISAGLQAQEKRVLTFKELGWTITIPDGYTVLDSAKQAANNQKGEKILENSTGLEIDASATRTLVSINNGPLSYLNATITPYDETTDGDYGEVSQQVNDILYNTMQEQLKGAPVDSSTTEIVYGSLTFRKFTLTIKLNAEKTMVMVMLSRLYKGWDFGISYIYVDEKGRLALEGMLQRSEFAK